MVALVIFVVMIILLPGKDVKTPRPAGEAPSVLLYLGEGARRPRGRAGDPGVKEKDNMPLGSPDRPPGWLPLGGA